MRERDIRKTSVIDLEESAIYVVNMFDQANTGGAVENLGSRGRLLKQAIEELRVVINKHRKKTILTSKQVNSD